MSAQPGDNRERTPCPDGYEVLREVGRGGMGVVYLARELNLNRQVALKMLLPGACAGPEGTLRFRREAEALARLHNDHIVHIHAVGEYAGRPFFALEYVDGGSLAAHLDGTPRPPRQAARLVQVLAEAMDLVHQGGIVHRDLKPDNILLAAQAPAPGPLFLADRLNLEDWTPKITDFGLAKPLTEADQGHTATGLIVGTPSYMAPEQAAGKAREVGPAADVYALGVILYELVTGRPPFKGATILDTLEQVRAQDPVPPRSLVPRLDRNLETVCLKCLRKQPEKRYASARELAGDLKCFLDNQPVRARRSGVWERTVRWARRRPAWATFWSFLTFALLASAVVVPVYLARLHAALKQAEENLKESDVLVEDFYTRISTNRLLNVPGLQPLRTELLERALRYYDARIRRYGDDPQTRARLALAAHRAAVLNHALRRTADARAAFEKALRLRRQLVADAPGDARRKEDLAATLNALGTFVREDQGRQADADASYCEALKLREEAAAAAPEDVDFQSGLSTTLHDLSIHLKYRNAEEAMRLAERALAIRERLDRQAPSAERRLDLAMSYHHLGNLQTDNRRKPDALVSYRKALAIRRALAERRQHQDIDLEEHLGWSCNNLGLLLSEIGQPEEALKYYAEALALRERLAGDNPSVFPLQNQFASSYNNLGLLHFRMGNGPAALEAFDGAARARRKLLVKDPRNVFNKTALAHIEQNKGNLFSAAGEKFKALGAYQDALQLREELYEADRKNTFARKHLAYTLRLLGELEGRLERFEDAGRSLRRCLDVCDQLYRENPKNGSFLADLVCAHAALGGLLGHAGKSGEALRSSGDALTLADRLVVEHPHVPEYAAHRGRTLLGKGMLLAVLRRQAEARVIFERAVEVCGGVASRNPGIAEFQADVANCRHHLGCLQCCGHPEAGLAALKEARRQRQEIARHSPHNVDDRNRLGETLGELGMALVRLKRHAEALPLLEEASRHHRAAFAKGPDVPGYRRQLAVSLLRLTGAYLKAEKKPEAAAAFEEWRRLYRINAGDLLESLGALARWAAGEVTSS